MFVERRMDCQALKTLPSRFKKILTVVTLVCEHFLIFDKHMQFYHHNYQKKYDSYLDVFILQVMSCEIKFYEIGSYELQHHPFRQKYGAAPFIGSHRDLLAPVHAALPLEFVTSSNTFHSLSISLVVLFL